MAWGGMLVLMIAGSGLEGPPATTCARVAKPIAAGAIATRDDLAPAACAGADKPAFRYDRTSGAARAIRNLLVGEIVAFVPPSALAGVSRGQRLTLEARVGPVLVRREVEAVQAAKPGQDLFVRGADGSVFVAPFPEKVP